MKLVKIFSFFCIITFSINQILAMRSRDLGVDLNGLANMTKAQKDIFYSTWHHEATIASDQARENMDRRIKADIQDIKDTIKKFEQDENYRNRLLQINPRIKKLLEKRINLLETLRDPFKISN